jgi:hypothetical protein
LAKTQISLMMVLELGLELELESALESLESERVRIFDFVVKLPLHQMDWIQQKICSTCSLKHLISWESRLHESFDISLKELELLPSSFRKFEAN